MQRKKPLRRSAIPRSRKPIKARKKDPTKRRWAKHRNDAFRVMVRGLPCELTGHLGCLGHIECAHVKARSTGGADIGNCVPLCVQHHRLQHQMGTRTFELFFDLDLKASATRLGVRYIQDNPGASDPGGGASE